MSVFAVIINSVVDNIVDAENGQLVALVLPEAESIIEVTDATGPAYVGGTYSGGKFIAPKPYPSWVFSDESNGWVAPVAHPTEVSDGAITVWDESVTNWVEVQVSGLEIAEAQSE